MAILIANLNRRKVNLIKKLLLNKSKAIVSTTLASWPIPLMYREFEVFQIFCECHLL